MGIGSYISLINATPWAWNLTGGSTYQMNSWSFPGSIPAGSVYRVYVEQNDASGLNTYADVATITYELDGPDGGEFGLEYGVGASGTYMYANFTSLNTVNNVAGSSTGLYWAHNYVTPWIIGSDNDIDTTALVSCNPPPNWMTQTLDRISCLTLREVSLPGTHDSGMSAYNAHTPLSLAENTVSQLLNVSQQLESGVRFLDIRPTISGGAFVTGHYDWIDQPSGWQGADGESIADIISDINGFTSQYNELIIVTLSHPLDSDNFPSNSTYSFTQDQWDALFAQLQEVNFRVANNDPTADLSQNTVGFYISNSSAVLFVVQEDGVDLTDWNSLGFYASNQYPLYNDYSDSDDYSFVVSDQLTKLIDQRQAPEDPPFLLAWTWTASWKSITQSLTDNGQMMNSMLWDNLWENVNTNTYPNIISVDAFPSESSPVTALAMAINYWLAPSCSS